MRVMYLVVWVNKTAHVKLGEPTNVGCIINVK